MTNNKFWLILIFNIHEHDFKFWVIFPKLPNLNLNYYTETIRHFLMKIKKKTIHIMKQARVQFETNDFFES